MLKSSPLISVIMPCCNSEHWIEQAIESVLQQTHRELELIVIDDASSDATSNILENIRDPRIRLITREQRSGGPATPRNQGLAAAKGDYLAFIDSDDIWHAEKLERQLKAIEQHELNFISSNHICFTDNTPKAPSLDEQHRRVSRKSHQDLLTKNWVITSSALIDRKLFDGVSFNQESQYIGVEDYLAWLHIHQSPFVKSAVLEAPLVFYRLRKDSLSHSKIKMAGKIFYLLGNYQHKGRPLGILAFYYFGSYVYASVSTRLWGKR